MVEAVAQELAVLLPMEGLVLLVLTLRVVQVRTSELAVVKLRRVAVVAELVVQVCLVALVARAATQSVF
jgi:hypothetical protein